uniref:Uncharacterized protein LOC111104879 n=1 Tax=Crassostrea virginica TaxID=6565 RepID=A0A8B8AWV1_CRAVI|nr:uncharacterized protein LOC111104879 [Crassostrea virginica]
MAIISTLIVVNILILCIDLPVSAMETESSGCQQGFFGPNCKFPCRFPNYGKRCQLECNCTEELCNNISGCPNPATETTTGNNSETHRGRSGPDEDKSDETKTLKIFYSSNINFTSGEEILHAKSTWNSLDRKHKAMLVSICIFVAFFLTLTSVCLTKSRKTEAIVSYYCFWQK